MTDDTTRAAPAPGHPDGCGCDPCIRAQHDDQDPKHQRCNEHGRCMGCEGCVPCGMEEDRSREIGSLIREYPVQVDRAVRAVGCIRDVVTQLMDFYDIETAEGSDGPDALAELDEIQRRMRNIRRIAAARYALEREQEIAAALADDDVPEFHDDIVVAFTRDQVNEWAGRRLTDGELAKIAQALPFSSVPVAVYALVATLGPDGPQDSQGMTIPAGEPFPLRPGYVTGECGHAVAGSEWKAGFRRCEHCPPGPQDEPEEPEIPGSGLTAEGAGPLLDPDCRAGKCRSCVGAPCEHECHRATPPAEGQEGLTGG